LLRSLILCTLLVLSAVTYAQQVQIMQLSDPYAGYARTLINAPQEIVDILISSAPDKSQSDNVHAQYHLILAKAYYNLTYPQKSLEHAQSALHYVAENQQSWLYHHCKITEATALDSVGTPMRGMNGLNAAIIWANQTQDSKLYLLGLFSRGILQISLTDYVQALDDFQQAYSLAGDDPNELSKPHVAAMLAQVYEYRGEFNLALPYYEEAVAAHRLHHADLDLSIALYGLGKANRITGNVQLGKTQLEESAQLAKKVDDIQGVAYALKELAEFDLLEKDYVEAENKLLKASSIFVQANNTKMDLSMMSALANLALDLNDTAKAERYLTQTEGLFDHQNMSVQSIAFDETRARLLYQQGQYQLAYDGLKQVFENHKKNQNADSTQLLHQLRSRFEVQLAQQDNQVLSQQNSLQQLQLGNKKNLNMQLILITFFVTIVCALLFVIVLRNKAHKRRLEKLATRDELTDLYNRRHTLVLLEQQMALAARHDNKLCIAMLDLDWFKQINDSYGHVAGDKVLREFAVLCKKSLRDSDVIGRIGGEEFLLILSHTVAEDAQKVLDSLRSKMVGLSKTAGIPETKVTISIGIAEYKQDDSLENFMLLADTALYRAKNNGRDQVVISDRNITISAQNNLAP
jgi:diguanylate cyclase (GGDEF)-like protein